MTHTSKDQTVLSVTMETSLDDLKFKCHSFDDVIASDDIIVTRSNGMQFERSNSQVAFRPRVKQL